MNDVNYSADRKLGDKFMPEVMSIMGRIARTTEYELEDTERNTDLITVNMKNLRIGVRVRRYSAYRLYDDFLRCFGYEEFTIRFTKKSGYKTEFEKVVADGFGDLFFYGFANEDETELIRWVVIDYDAFRHFIFGSLWDKDTAEFLRGRIHTVRSNGDRFIVFRNDEIPNGIVADSEHWQKVTA